LAYREVLPPANEERKRNHDKLLRSVLQPAILYLQVAPATALKKKTLRFANSLCVCVFCTDRRTNSDIFRLQRLLADLIKRRDEKI